MAWVPGTRVRPEARVPAPARRARGSSERQQPLRPATLVRGRQRHLPCTAYSTQPAYCGPPGPARSTCTPQSLQNRWLWGRAPGRRVSGHAARRQPPRQAGAPLLAQRACGGPFGPPLTRAGPNSRAMRWPYARATRWPYPPGPPTSTCWPAGRMRARASLLAQRVDGGLPGEPLARVGWERAQQRRRKPRIQRAPAALAVQQLQVARQADVVQRAWPRRLPPRLGHVERQHLRAAARLGLPRWVGLG
jgi:hypothetical protein